MHQIADALRAAPRNLPLTAAQVNVISATFVYETAADTAVPNESIPIPLLVKRVDVVSRLLRNVVSRLPDDQRDVAHALNELTPRESEVCWLVASGQIDLVCNEVQ